MTRHSCATYSVPGRASSFLFHPVHPIVFASQWTCAHDSFSKDHLHARHRHVKKRSEVEGQGHIFMVNYPWIILYCSLDYCSFARFVSSKWKFAFTKFKFTGPMLTTIAFKGKPITESKLLTYIFTNPWNDVNQILIECSINSVKWIEYPGFSIKLAEQKIVSNMYRKFVRFSMKKID